MGRCTYGGRGFRAKGGGFIMESRYYIVEGRAYYERSSLYRFSKEELDAAERLANKYIGKVGDVKCYLMPVFDEGSGAKIKRLTIK